MSSAKQLSKALAFKREAWMQLAILDGLGRDPSRDRDIAFDAYSDAREEYTRIITDLWKSRWLERYVHGVSKPYQNPVPTQVPALRTEHVRAA